MINYDTIIRPLVTEKTTMQKDDYNQYSFEISPKANRVDVRKAIEAIFDVNVKGVSIMNVKGKVKQRGRIVGKRKNWKKAVVALNAGDRIEFFEGA